MQELCNTRIMKIAHAIVAICVAKILKTAVIIFGKGWSIISYCMHVLDV